MNTRETIIFPTVPVVPSFWVRWIHSFRQRLYARLFERLVNEAIDGRMGVLQSQLLFATQELSNRAVEDRRMLADMISTNLVRLKESIVWGPQLWQAERDHSHPPAGHRAIFPEFELLVEKLNESRTQQHQEMAQRHAQLAMELERLRRRIGKLECPEARLGATE
jgi:hypothetical protein